MKWFACDMIRTILCIRCRAYHGDYCVSALLNTTCWFGPSNISTETNAVKIKVYSPKRMKAENYVE